MIEISVDAKATQAALGDMQNQFPFAVSKGLNDLAIRVADVQRTDMQMRFTIRNPNVLKYGIVRTKKATKGDFSSAVGVSTQRTGSREAFGYLNKFEAGIRKLPISGSTVAVPEEAKRTKRDIVQASYRIPNLQLRRVGNQIKGTKRTFLIKPKSGRAAALILQAVGRGKRAIHRVLYVLERSVPIRPDLHFHDNARKTASSSEGARIMANAAAEALRTARK